jgi:hypothetical protein
VRRAAGKETDMSYWLYHQQMPLCRVRRLIDDRAESGTVVLALPANLVGDLCVLTHALELYEDQSDHREAIQGLAVHLAGDEIELTVMMMGGWRDADEQRFNDDRLLVDGKPLCRIEQCIIAPGACPNGLHVRFTLAGEALRRINYRRQRLQALRQVQQMHVHDLGRDAIGLMTPLADDGPKTEAQPVPRIEILRLRHRLRIPATLDLADSGAAAITVVGHAGAASALANRQASRGKKPIKSTRHPPAGDSKQIRAHGLSTRSHG